MEKKNIDWSNLGFGYMQTDMRYVSTFRDGAWDEGGLTDKATIEMSECAGVLQYAQTCFEGLKAYTTADGKIVCFRPDLNATRMVESAERLKMPPFPAERFLDAIKDYSHGGYALMGVFLGCFLAALLLRQLRILTLILPDLESTIRGGMGTLSGQLTELAGKIPGGISGMLQDRIRNFFSGGSALSRISWGGRFSFE